jgi:hypothetical protein
MVYDIAIEILEKLKITFKKLRKASKTDLNASQ